ncbi:polysaccharide deacetylase family protein [Streptomyces sp. 1331.2]|uniref:polysaccharide deacetylase family protein n=1 Tax=Streptomyces sp. 1331.2 TaxID=1938835 RepID=UPI000BD70D6D|nr:polysaccharide deacetylase family protein [Streptomyces sp. 1331.2]SOB84761.1 Peptidoglycan/xylan/chitin deacetylase, PgdA/CDA1 family [Streptomyces sp. 1331.2]
MHRTARRPCAPNRPSRSRRRLIAGCAAVAAVLGLAACGTASGALQSPAPSTTAQPPVAGQPDGTAASTIAPTPGSDGLPPVSSSGSSGSPGSSAPSVPAAPATPRTPAGPTPSSSAAPSSPAVPTTTPVPGSPAAASSPAAPPPHPGAGTVIGSTASGGRTVALTFDDGPGPATGQILDLLAQYHAKATFCEIGQNAAANPAAVKRVLAAGHRLCDHSVHHPQPFAKLPHDKAVYEITAARDMIVQAGGPGTRVDWFRAPGGGFNADNEQVTASLGMGSLGWSVDPRDWSRPGVPAIVSTVQKQLKPGGVILMHDGGGDRSQTVAALKQLLPWLVAQGYTFDFPAQ